MFSGSDYETSGPPNKKGLGELIVEMAKPLYENCIMRYNFVFPRHFILCPLKKVSTHKSCTFKRNRRHRPIPEAPDKSRIIIVIQYFKLITLKTTHKVRRHA